MGFRFQFTLRRHWQREGSPGLSQTPSEGLFYLGPVPIRRRGVWSADWMIDSNPFEVYGPLNWDEYWATRIAPDLITCWGPHLSVGLVEIGGLATALPRGEVAKASGIWRIVCGEQLPIPAGLVLNTIIHDFGLMNEEVEFAVDSRLNCDPAEESELRRLLCDYSPWEAAASCSISSRCCLSRWVR